MAVAVANARGIEGGRGALGIVNWVSARLLAAAHSRWAFRVQQAVRSALALIPVKAFRCEGLPLILMMLSPLQNTRRRRHNGT